jgi:pilus assembly protein CpaB
VKLTPAKVTMMMLVAVGGLIGLYVIKGLFAVEKKVEPRPRIVSIPLATAYLAPGTKISDTHVGMGPYPERELKGDMLRSTRVVVGRVVKEAIKPGEPMRGSQLYEPGENAPLQIGEGKKAIAITVKSSTEIVDGLIKPGDFVDVHFTLDGQFAGTLDQRLARLGGITTTLLKGVKVLALNKTFRQSPLLPTGNSVTLELAAEQTNVLLVAQPSGTISLTFNPLGEGDGGVALSNADRATLWEILGLKKAVPPPVEEPEKPFVTDGYRGIQGNTSRWNKDGKAFDSSGQSSANQNPPNDQDNFDPNDVFLSPGGSSNDVPSQDYAPPAAGADPDIPAAQPGTAHGVRSRVGSMLRARPKSASSAPGPTALRN